MHFLDASRVQWLKSISKIQLLEKEDLVYKWRDRIFKQFEGTIKLTHTQSDSLHSSLQMLHLLSWKIRPCCSHLGQCSHGPVLFWLAIVVLSDHNCD